MKKSRKSKLANSIGRGPRGRQALVLLHRLQRCEKLAQGPKSRVVAGGFGARGPAPVRTMGQIASREGFASAARSTPVLVEGVESRGDPRVHAVQTDEGSAEKHQRRYYGTCSAHDVPDERALLERLR